MSLDEHYSAALTALATEIGVDAKALNDHQTLIVGEVTLILSPVAGPDGTAIQCACKVGPLPPHPSADMLRLLLQANTLGPVTAGSSFGLQLGADDIVLEQRYSVDTPTAALARACRAQCETSLIWAAALAQGLPLTSAA